MIRSLSASGYRPRVPVEALEFADAAKREDWINTKGMTVFSMYHATQPGLTIDLFARYSIPFDELWARSQVFEVDGTGIRVCSLDDLLRLKEMAGRNKDKDDIEKLLQIKNHEK